MLNDLPKIRQLFDGHRFTFNPRTDKYVVGYLTDHERHFSGDTVRLALGGCRKSRAFIRREIYRTA